MLPIGLFFVAAVSVINVQSSSNNEEVIQAMKFIKKKPKRMYTVDRQNVTITCRVIGNPKPMVWWVHNGNNLTNERYQMLDTGDLFIRDVERSDAGSYRCTAQDVNGSIMSLSGELIVKEHTKITDKPEDYEAEVGTPVTFRCSAVADKTLNLTVEWQRDKRTIDFKRDPRFVITSDFSLTISKTAAQDTGIYTCLARTDLDKVTANATLTVVDTPNAPILESIECHQTKPTIHWRPNGDNHSPILYYIVEHNTSFTSDTWEISSNNISAIDFSYSVDMSPWANYTFRVIAVNKVGPSSPSGPSDVCTTSPSVPFKNPDNVEGQGTEPSPWLLVAMVSIMVIAFLVLLLIVIRIIKRNCTTNSYDVQNLEMTDGNNEYAEACVFSKYSKPLSSPFWRFSEFLSKSIQMHHRRPASNDYDYPQWIHRPQTAHKTPSAVQSTREISNIYEEIN